MPRCRRSCATSRSTAVASNCVASKRGRWRVMSSARCWRARRGPRTGSRAPIAWSRCVAASRSRSRARARRGTNADCAAPPGSQPMSARLRIVFALLWLAALLLAGWWIGAHLQLTGDLRKFMPAPETREQKLLIEELGEGPGSRLLLVALSGADAPTLAAQSKALRTMLAGDAQFVLVANG